MNNLPAEKNRRILIIDDNRAIHDDFRKILSSPTVAAAALDVTEAELFGKEVPHGGMVQQIRYEIDSAYQGQEGVLLVKQALEAGRPYAMAFVDVRMPPGMDGVETTRKIWELDPDLQVVLCTAYSDYSWDEMFEKLGQHDGLLILKKPFDTVEALQLAHALTEKWWLRQQSKQKMEELEGMVAGRTRELQQSNQALQTEVVEHQRAEETLRESEERFSGAFEHAPIGVALVSPDGRYLKVNRVLCDLVGYSEAELLTRTFQDITHPEDLEVDLENVRRLLAGEIRSYQMEKRYVHARGHLVTVLLNVSLVLDGQGQPRYFISQVQDITERKRLEAKLDRERDLWRTLLDNSPDHIYFKDVQSRFIKASKAQARQFGLKSPDAMVGKTDFDFFDEAHARPAFEDEQEIIRTGQPMIAKEEREDWKDGHVTWASSTKMPMRDGSGKIIGIMGISRDITERKRMEEVLTFLAGTSTGRPDEPFFNTLARYLAQSLGMDFVCIDRLEGEGLNARTIAVWCDGKFEDNVTYALKDTPCGDVVGQTVCCFPAGVSRLFPRDQVLKKLRAESYVGVTLWNHTGQPIGLIAVIGRTPLANRSLAEATLKMVAMRVASELERLDAMEALRDSEERFRTLVETAPEAIFIQTDRRFAYVNAAALRLFGATRPDELLGQPVLDRFHPDFRMLVNERIRLLNEDRQPVASVDEVYLTLAGSPKDVNVSAVPFTYQNQNGALVFVRDITERKRAEAALRDSEAFLDTVIEKIPNMIFVKDAKELRFVKFNQAGQELLGYSLAELAGKNDYDFFPKEMADYFAENDRKVLRGREVVDIPEEPVQTREKGERILHTKKIPILDNAGQLVYLLGISEDITERKRLETQLIQSQKMETVGKLAGGIAHEFNSILTAIIGQSELLLGDLPAGSPLAKNATEITQAADRAATLTRQLLAYGRKQFLRPEALNLNQVITSMDGVLSHLMGGEMVDVNIVPATGLKAVKADTGQVEQVIMNLAMNARDAMPHGGKLTLETANVSFDQDSVGRNPELKPGAYVMLAITDTGRGMSEKVKAHAFEPFFTTKDVGQGTGLGLSTCYGIIKQSGGHINVYSEPGRGTTFKIYLPQVEPPPKIPIERLDSPDLPRGTETILLVEDDPALREMAAALLRRLGYTVLVAANGIEALSLKQQRDIGHVDLLFTDVVMPHMSGKELSERVRALYPHTRILFTSAYTENAIVHQGVLDKGVALLQKPFTPSALALKVREALDQPGVPKPDAASKTSGLTKSSNEAMTPGN